MEDTYEVKLSLFEGPFDLLLFFIERDELDINDIPISKVTADFLNYIQHLESLNIEVASEFILVAAKLMRIKAKLLLPRPQLDEHGEEIDPRVELVRHLLEYKKYKALTKDLANMEEQRLLREARGNTKIEWSDLSEQNGVEVEMQNLDMYKLLKVYQKVVERFENRKEAPIHTIVQYPYSIEDQKTFLKQAVANTKVLSFEEIIEYNPSKIFFVFTFLAILELVQLNELEITIGNGFNNFWVEAPAHAQEANS